MYGAYARPRCPSCRASSGPDCADASRGTGGQRRYEDRQWRRDWDEDIYQAQQERYDLETLGSMIALVWDGDARSYLKHYYDAVPLWGSAPYVS